MKLYFIRKLKCIQIVNINKLPGGATKLLPYSANCLRLIRAWKLINIYKVVEKREKWVK